MRTIQKFLPVTRRDDFDRLVAHTHARFTSVETNCILTAEEIDRLIKRGSLYYDIDGAGVCFLDDEGDYYRAHFYFKRDARFSFAPLEKPVIVEFLVTEYEAREAVKDMERRWMDNGFLRYIVNLKMYLPLDGYKPHASTIHSHLGTFSARWATEKDADQILSMWREALNPTNSAIPSREELLYEISNRSIVVMANEKEVAAANKMVIAGETVSTWLGTTRPEYRRIGLSTAMKQFIYKTAIEKGCTLCYTWVDRENKVSVRALEKIGFRYLGEHTEGFILPARP